VHPLLAALITTLLLGFCILFLIIRPQSNEKKIEVLEAKINAPSPKVIRGDETRPPVPLVATKSEAPAKAPTAAVNAKATYFDASESLLATLSHELKTPLNGIKGIAQILR
jgi:signal transduction histidine kinase